MQASHNGNKIITGSSGGCLLTNNIEDANKARKWATQARENAAWYQHEEVGYNYRMRIILEGHVRNAICNQLKLLSDLGYQLEQKQKNNERIFTDAKKYLEQRIEYLKADKIRKYEAYAAGNLDKDLFIKQKEEINSELQQHRDKLNSVKSENEENARLIFAIHRTENKASRLLENRELTPEIVDAFIDVIYVYSKERIEIVFKFEDLLEEAFSKLEKESCLNA